MDSSEFTEWLAYFRIEANPDAPVEFDNPEQHSAALDSLFTRLGK